jgi:hypothetical protein
MKGWLFCGANDIVKNAMEKKRKGIHKMASRNVFNTFTVAGRIVYLHKGIILKKI